MAERFRKIEAMLEETVPVTAGLVRRVGGVPALVKAAVKAGGDYGEAYCGGRIELSLRKVLGG